MFQNSCRESNHGARAHERDIGWSRKAPQKTKCGKNNDHDERPFFAIHHGSTNEEIDETNDEKKESRYHPKACKKALNAATHGANTHGCRRIQLSAVDRSLDGSTGSTAENSGKKAQAKNEGQAEKD